MECPTLWSTTLFWPENSAPWKRLKTWKKNSLFSQLVPTCEWFSNNDTNRLFSSILRSTRFSCRVVTHYQTLFHWKEWTVLKLIRHGVVWNYYGISWQLNGICLEAQWLKYSYYNFESKLLGWSEIPERDSRKVLFFTGSILLRLISNFFISWSYSSSVDTTSSLSSDFTVSGIFSFFLLFELLLVGLEIWSLKFNFVLTTSRPTAGN